MVHPSAAAALGAPAGRRVVANIEERVANLEGRMHTQERRIDNVREAIVGLGNRIASLEARVDTRLTSLEARFDTRFVGLEQRMTSLEEQGNSQFRWLLGTQVTTLAAVVGAMAAIVVAFAGR
jgi:uncharacterized coiled-coil protein SlyX